MKCPNLIKKKSCGGELQTKRTHANGTKVRRERVCPKCRARFWTVEQFETELSVAEYQRGEHLRIREHKIRDLETQISEHQKLFLGFRDLMDKAAGQVKP